MTPNLKRVIRLDSLPLGQTMFTHEGYLMDRPILTSTGIFEYHNPDGSVRRELRLPDEVFAKESLESYKGKPIIVTHDAGLIDKNNVHDESIGTILSDGYQDGDDVRAEIVIHDTDEMRESRLKELSLGYNLDLDETPGVWNGEPYDAIQRNIRINHLALVREARAGEQARLNIDSRDFNILKGGKTMAKKKLTKKTARRDGVLSPEELAKAIEQYKARRAERMAAADEEELEKNAAAAATDEGEETVAVAGQDPETIEEQVQLVKDRRDRRDEAGDPETVEEAQGVIANQDEDIDVLFDIIDTLLAKEAFDEAEGETAPAEGEETASNEGEEEEVAADEGEETEGEETDTDEGEEETAEENTDEGDDETACDEDDDVVAEDEGEEECENADEDEEETPAASNGAMNADSVDAIVRTRIKLGMIGRTLNLDGLENMNIMKAKKKVIKAVRPNIRLDGKGATFINAAFDLACDEVKNLSKKNTAYQKKQMFNKSTSRADSKTTRSGAESARERMIKKMNKEGK